jgi:hypothetical protein
MKDGANYQPKGCSQLLPCDLRDIRNYLLASQDLKCLRNFVMILIGTKLFLRPDELVNIRAEDFVPNLFARQGNKIIGMAVKVQGKRDERWQHLWLWADDMCPDLCPLRHLFVYLHLSRHAGGYLFPTNCELDALPSSGVFETHFEYRSFLRDFKSIVSVSLPKHRSENMKIGLHMFRKCGYLLAIWGDGEWEMIKKGARHKSKMDAEIYRRDADSLKALQNEFEDPRNRVGKYKPIYIDAPWEHTSLNMHSSAFSVPFHAAPGQFVRESLGIPPESPFYNSQQDLLRMALVYVNDSTTSEKLDDLISENLPEKQQAAARELINKAVAERFLVWQQQYITHVGTAATHNEKDGKMAPLGPATEIMKNDDGSKQNSTNSCVEATGNETGGLSSELGKRKRRGGMNDLEGRKKIAKISGLGERVQLLQLLYKQKPTSNEELTPGARTFVLRTMLPVLGCLEHHFGNNVDDFCQHWRQTFVVKFGAQCCAGRKEQGCGTKQGKN